MLNMGYQDCKKNNLAWVVIRTRVEINKYLENGKNCYVETHPSKPSRIDCDRNYEIFDTKHNSCIRAVNNNTRRIKGSNVVDFSDVLDSNTLIEMSKKITIKEDSLVNKKEIIVKVNDLDHNGHVNNARYIEFVFNKNIV